jgi:glutaminase
MFSVHNYDSLVASKKEDPRRLRTSTETMFTYRAIQAASVGDVSELKRLIAHGHEMDAADYDGRTPLHLACAENQVDTVRYLLNQGVATSPKDRWGNTPLEDARRHKRKEIVSLFAQRAQVHEAAKQVRHDAA